MDLSDDLTRVPDPVERPKLARWLWDRKLPFSWLAPLIGVSAEQVRRYCLEFGHDDRAVPGRDVLAKIARVTAGSDAVAERDFYPPHIRGEGPPPLKLVESSR